MRRRSEESRARLLATFRLEAEEHLQVVNAALASLRQSPAEEERLATALTLFRSIHTLKGAARSVGLLEVETVCQTLEAVLRRVTQGELALTPTLLEQVQETVDDLGRMVDGHPARIPVEAMIRGLETAGGMSQAPGAGSYGDPPPPEPAPSVPGAPPAVEPTARPVSGNAPGAEPAGTRIGEGTIRVGAAQLDSLLLQMEDLLLPKLAAGQRVRDLEKALEALSSYRREIDGTASIGLRSLEGDLRQLVRQLRADERQLARLHERLQDEVLRLRTSPVASVVDALPRMVRDLAREAEKEVELTITGTELELDRRVLERLKDPLIHLVRNAVDHGIEMPDIRERLNKPRRGRINISFSPADNHRIEVSIQDDGAGVRLDDVRAAATRSRLLTVEQAEGLDGRAAEELLFHSGFSTSPVVTRVSGHGLGLSIVRERVESIGGTLHLETVPEVGTTLRMLLPATIATFTGLLARSGGQLFLFPVEAVKHVLRVPRAEIGSVEGRITLQREGQFLRAATLHSLLQLPPVEQPSEPERLPCVVLSTGEEHLGILVDEVLGERELLAKELEPPLVRVPHVAGAGVLGTGNLVLILRPADLLRTAAATRSTPLKPAASTRPQRQPVVLVVDDSITTRMMEKNLLESAGYTVHTAVDGMEAWTYLKSETCDLVVSDVDMPRMDGFELTTRIRGDAALRDLPVILVTAMESREHRERGVLAGANAYVIKSNFEESNLLEIIHRLL